MSELIRYQNGVTIEVAAPQNRAVPVSDSRVQKLQTNFDATVKSLEPLLRPIQEMIGRILAETHLKEAEVKMGVSFSAEGNLFVTKATAEANLEFTLKYERR